MKTFNTTVTVAEQDLLDFFNENSPLHFVSALTHAAATYEACGYVTEMSDKWLPFVDILLSLAIEKEGAKA